MMSNYIPETPPILAKLGLADRTLPVIEISGVGILGTGATGPEDWCRFDTPGIGVVDRDPIPPPAAFASPDAESRRWAICRSNTALAASLSSLAALLDDLDR